MTIAILTRSEFLKLVYDTPARFMDRIHAPEAFVVRGFYDADAVLALRDRCFRWGQETGASWHPLLDECPDYHRIHDNYPKAHVKAKMHAFYQHAWYAQNAELFVDYREIFEIKNFLAGLEKDEYLDNVPSTGPIARVNLHQYPRGGGYQAEHIDPVADWAKIQTLVQASRPGVDYQSGGLYARLDAEGEKFYVDPATGPGDLMVLSPGIRHGVEEVDPDAAYEIDKNTGRWIVMPIIVASDYPNPEVVRPRQVS